MFETVKPEKKKILNTPYKCYIRVGLKSFYISNEAGKMLKGCEWCTIQIDPERGWIRIIPTMEKNDDSFKLSSVCESQFARRIETNKTIQSMIAARMPTDVLDMRIPATEGFGHDGSIIADWTYNCVFEDEDY